MIDEQGVAMPQSATGVLFLREVRIRRFRSLQDVAVPIRPGMTVLTGENDGGKTTVLDAIRFLLAGSPPKQDDKTYGTAKNEAIEVEGTFRSTTDEAGTVRVRAILPPDGPPRREILDRIHPRFGARPADLPLNNLRVRMRELGIPIPGGSAKPPVVAEAEAWLSRRPDAEFEDKWRPATEDELARLPSMTSFESVRAPSPRADIQSVILGEAHRLLREEGYAGRLSELGTQLDQDAQAALDRIRAKIREYCPDLEDVVVSASFNFARPGLNLDIRVRRAGQDVDLDAEGEGRKRRVTLAIHEANLGILEQETPGKAELLAYDEPDTHLDYASQRGLFGILERQAQLEHVQVVVATHSLNFIDRVPLDAIVHLRLGDDYRTRVEGLQGEDHKEEILFLESVGRGLGLRNSVLLDERCFLLVEGETEEAAVPVLFRLATNESLTAAGIVLVNTRGYASVRQLMGVLHRDWRRHLVILSDSDQRPDVLRWAAALGLREGSQVFFIGEKEFEDAFRDETWLSVLRSHFAPRDGGGDWTLDEVRSARFASNGMGHGLSSIVSRRCQRTVRKPELCYELARTVSNGDEIPQVLRDCFAAARAEAARLA